MMESIPVIVLSDDEDIVEDDSLNDSSVLIVENVKTEAKITQNIVQVDEDLVITHSQTGTVLPHARYDFKQRMMWQDHYKIMPSTVTSCEFWTVPGMCHCNAHKRSIYWKHLRDKSLLGFLHELDFNFDPVDLDSDLRRAENLLQKFAASLGQKYATYLLGFPNPYSKKNCKCSCHCENESSLPSQNLTCKGCHEHHLKLLQYDYSAVDQHIKSFFHVSKMENPKTRIVMLLGAIKLFMSHTAPGNTHAINALAESVSNLLWRFMTKALTLLVEYSFSNSFTNELESFFQRCNLHYSNLPLSLSVLPWDDPLLSGVMKGQNITGEKFIRGRKFQILHEHLIVIQARVYKLQKENKYRELARYLRIVKGVNSPTLQRVRDMVPFCLLKVGDYHGAVNTLLSPMQGQACPASRLTPPEFRAYLRILVSGHVPEIKPDYNPANGQMLKPDNFRSNTWISVEGSSLLKMMEVLKFALRVLDCNTTVFADSESWIYLISLVGCTFVTPTGLVIGSSYAEPDVAYQTRSRVVACEILKELTMSSRINIPKSFETCYIEQSRILLTVQALVLRIFHSKFTPIIDAILSFRLNSWALHWFYTSLIARQDILPYVLCGLLEELAAKRFQSLPKWGESENSLIGSFLSLFFLENGINLDINTYPINYLISMWNELSCPWQKSLRLHLEDKVDKLTPNYRNFLQIIQKR
ncbi:hypothetical protein DNTS_017117 [Danionella cerebrum]|uniref:Uncharacterized protein n=1 Tax=Danionella cerebrum TaxID=2873325 RepID=A0A553NG42_9TELE|nr:hypothetical protein DNTS_017117 [Danionella translucida]